MFELSAPALLTAIASTPARSSSAPQFLSLFMGLVGGLALFLYGMDRLSEALKSVAGDRMKRILARLTTNRLMGAATGAFVTAVIQSSSVTTVLVIGFITAGLMTFSQSIGIIMGANVGTTVTAQVIAFHVTEYSLLMIAVGFLLWSVKKGDRFRDIGLIILGLGLVFLGMSVMGEAMAPLGSYQPFLDFMVRMERPAVGIVVAALFTALVQSSSATTGIVLVMAGQGLISLTGGIALIFGANIGTCVTALLAAINKPREAVRASMVHVLFNVLGVLIWLPFIDQLAALVVAVSPTSVSVSPRQIANAHTVFNVVNTMLLLPFSTQIARFVEWLVPELPPEKERLVRAKYLDTDLLTTPSLALDRARLEILHLGDKVMEMMQRILPAMTTGSREDLEAVADLDDVVDRLHGLIVTYLGQISRATLSQDQTEEFLKLIEAANDLENIGDIIETNLVTLGLDRIEHGVTISESTLEVITGFHAVVTRALAAAMQAVTQKNEEVALRVIAMKPEVNRLADSAALHETRRLIVREPNRLPSYTVEVDMLQNLKRIFYFAKRMARVVVPADT